jgi:Fe-S cluster assembly protein SufD
MFRQFGHVFVHFFENYGFPDMANAMPGNSGGFLLFIPANVRQSKPIQITNIIDERHVGSKPVRNFVFMEAGSSAELLTGVYALSGEPCSYSDITEVALGEAATLDMVCLQKLNGNTRMTSSVIVHQAASSRMKTHYVTFGGQNVSNRLNVRLSGEKAEHAAYGFSVTQQTEHVGNEVLMIHASADCQSNQLFKHILSNTSTGAFTGRIVVEKGAQKTAAYQRSSNILLHPKAKMNICPQLEIYADDVKCSHGATVGQLDAEALFYLRSRGIGEEEAKKMLLQAFASEAINSISCAPFKESILQLAGMENDI